MSAPLWVVSGAVVAACNIVAVCVLAGVILTRVREIDRARRTLAPAPVAPNAGME